MKITLEQFLTKYEGKIWGYPDGSYVGECLSLVKWYIKECFQLDPPPSGCNGARCYWSKFPSPLGTKFRKVANTPELVPERGWIAVWDENAGGGNGHIAIVLDATISKFTSLDQNWTSRVAQRESHYYKNVVGFLAPLSSTQEPMPETVQVERAKFEELVTKSTWYDANFVRFGELEGIDKDYKESEKNHEERRQKLASNLSATDDWDSIIVASARFSKLADEVEDYKDKWDREVTARKKDYEAHQAELGKLNTSIDSLKEEYDRKIQHLKAQVDEAIRQADVANKALSEATKFAKVWKWLVEIKTKFERK